MRIRSMGMVGGAVLLIASAGCKSVPSGFSAAPPPLPPDRAHLITADDAVAGRDLYLTKCSKCHEFYQPASYQAAEWHKWMSKMSRKTHLKPDEDALLNRYLDVFRAPSQSAPEVSTQGR